MSFRILVAFEAFQDIEALRIAVFGRERGGVARAYAGTAQEQQHIVFGNFLFQLAEEFRIPRAEGVEIPLHVGVLFGRHLHDADPVAFSFGSHIHNFDLRARLHQSVRFLRGDGAGIGELPGLAALTGGCENFCGLSHVVFQYGGHLFIII